MSKEYKIRNFQLDTEDDDETVRSNRTKREKNHIKSLKYKRKLEKIRNKNKNRALEEE
jgi:hypothetical protein